MTGGWTDRQTERQTDNSDFIGPSVGRGSNKLIKEQETKESLSSLGQKTPILCDSLF